MRFLIVEDNPDQREVYIEIIQREITQEAVIITASNGKEALRLFSQGAEKKEPIDIVVTDWDMPEKDGIWLTNQIIKSDESVPIIMISGKMGDENITKAMNAGVTQYLVKTTSIEDIAATIKTHLPDQTTVLNV